MNGKKDGRAAPRAVAVRPNGEVLVYGVIGDEWDGLDAKTVIADIDALGDVDELVIRINSPGGYVYEGLAIFNYLKAHPAHVTVHIDGLAASMASALAMAGDRIVMAANAMMMIHNPWDVAIGEAEDLRKKADVLDRLKAQIVAIYATRTGLDPALVAEMMDQETWLTAEEAKAQGFTDEVAAAERAAAMTRFDLSVFRNVPETLAGFSMAAVAVESKQGSMTMTVKTGSAESTTATATEGQAPAAPVMTTDADAIRRQATEAERNRVSDIQAAVRAAKLGSDFADALIRDGVSVDQARARIIAKWAEQDATPEPQNHVRATVVSDQVDRFRAGVEVALLARAGMGGERNEFTGMTLRELARESLNIRNINSRGMPAMQMVGVAFAPMMAGHHGTSDFANVLANVANKAMLRGYEEAEETFQRWTGRGVLTDFKPVKRVDLNLFDALPELPEGAEYTYGTIGDRGETIQLATYGKMFSITRQAIINDDLDSFTRVPMKMGRSAIRTVGNLVYAVLTANAAMADGVALFHASHGNLAGAAGAPSTATLDAMRTAMAVQKDPDSKAAGGLNIRPAFVITPVALEGTAKTALESEYDTAKGDKRVPNSVRGMAEVVADARLDAASTAAWYGAANQNMHDTIEVAYLDGVDTPYLETRDGWNVEGVEMKVRLDAGVKALDFRGLYKNAGA